MVLKYVLQGFYIPNIYLVLFSLNTLHFFKTFSYQIVILFWNKDIFMSQTPTYSSRELLKYCFFIFDALTYRRIKVFDVWITYNKDKFAILEVKMLSEAFISFYFKRKKRSYVMLWKILFLKYFYWRRM